MKKDTLFYVTICSIFFIVSTLANIYIFKRHAHAPNQVQKIVYDNQDALEENVRVYYMEDDFHNYTFIVRPKY